ncbi:unnamed protein product [Amaranthus hypochondriacus]
MPLMEQACHMEVIDSEVACFTKKIDVKDPLKEVLCDESKSLSEEAMFFEKEHDRAQACEEDDILESILEAEEVDSTKEECTMPPPKVSLKPLPSGLIYAYLDVEHDCPVIVNDALDDPSLEKLLVLLRKYKGVIEGIQ